MNLVINRIMCMLRLNVSTKTTIMYIILMLCQYVSGAFQLIKAQN